MTVIGRRMRSPFTMELHTEIEIRASVEAVWRVLADFSRYHEWNPFIFGIEGAPVAGETLAVHFARGGSNQVTFKPTVLYVEEASELRWLGRLVLPFLFDGEHRFAIEKIDEGRVRFIQHERFAGLLVPLMRRDLDTNTRKGFERMNRALKERVESNVE
jgi:hypothetical protein